MGVTIQPIRKLLIANRNEIARRIQRAATALGIQTVAVYSEADAKALHVREADEAWCIGPAPSLESYLRIDKLIEVAKASGADAIHPGYGFVSESPDFAKACEAAGIRLVGPTSQAIADMADKARAKEIARQAGLPCIPGFNSDQATDMDLLQAARDIGFPVMIKALAGGGGRGMRLVQDEAEFAAQLHSARLESKNAFNDDRVMLEKAIVAPRHIEIQVLADQYGHAIHLGERDCTVQRRHQKIVEEAPSPAVDVALRKTMGEAALKLVHATGYVGAGTVEFLLDSRGEFYFIEMNTRLQVEHGVTEAITGVDLVQWQLRIAGGEPLTLQQHDIVFTGHAIQGRLCAEDPAKDFMPQTGPVLAWSAPSLARCDDALQAGLEVSAWYDSLLAKVIAHAPTRELACQALANALNQTVLIGFEHNAAYLARIALHPVFVAGQFSTAFLAEQADSLLFVDEQAELPAEALIASLYFANRPDLARTWPAPLAAYSSTRAMRRNLRLHFGGALHTVSLEQDSLNEARIFTEKSTEPVTLSTLQWQVVEGGVHYAATMGTQPMRATVWPCAEGAWVRLSGQARALLVADHTLQTDSAVSQGQFQPLVKSPMNGKITQILVQPGQPVQAGDVLFCLEAMKMEHRIAARSNATVDSILVEVGQQMNMGQTLAQLVEVK
ncbi:biotin carboxylase N-terminal domain-containing protein [Limnobacter sp.]|uniref:acetyl/propionyl/methylcrotonyl-CoA carboxylase subunit alpha n=1 Tax=Limnobacter sp. TaxID=2003368 RepID=UPI00258E0076|nr:biotin carboxylase N-terminal domain-containing protein [Limnobacter sp.]